MNNILIIFTGYNQRAVIAFLRALWENKINDYAIIAASDKDMILQTQYADKVVFVRRNQQLCIEEICEAVELASNIYKSKGSIILPSTEALNRYILKFRTALAARGCVVPLVDEKLYENISDKEKFWKICKEHNLSVPDLLEVKNEYREPFVAKPKTYFAADGNVYCPVIVKSKNDFEDFVKNYNRNDFDYQEYISGESFYLLFYFTKKGAIYKFSQKNYAQQAGGKSIIAAGAQKLHIDSTIVREYQDLFLELGYYGFVMVELRKWDQDFYMIEANPRLWGPSQLFYDAGANLFEAFLYEYGFIKQIPVKSINYQEKYFWSGGLKGSIFKAENCVWLENGHMEVEKNLSLFLKNDIYKREDTLNIYEQENEEND